jgi:hypothetical protein
LLVSGVGFGPSASCTEFGVHKAVVRDAKRAETPRTARARKTPTPDSPFLRNDIPRVPRRHDIGDSLTRVLFRPPCETLEVGASDPSNDTRVAIATANVAVELWRTPHGECAVPSAGGRKWRRGVRARRFFFVPIVHGSVPGLRICFVSQLDSLPKAWRSLGPESHTSATSFCAHVALLLAHSRWRLPRPCRCFVPANEGRASPPAACLAAAPLVASSPLPPRWRLFQGTAPRSSR